jgi:hypothetical protein
VFDKVHILFHFNIIAFVMLHNNNKGLLTFEEEEGHTFFRNVGKL